MKAFPQTTAATSPASIAITSNEAITTATVLCAFFERNILTSIPKRFGRKARIPKLQMQLSGAA